MSRDREAAVTQHLLEQILVHAERGSSHAGADVGNSGELEQPLHGPVLTEGSVEDGQDDVDRPQGCRRVGRRNGQRLGHRAVAHAELPATVAADGDGDDVVLLGVEGLQHGAGGGERDLVLGRPAARENRDPQPGHYGGPGVVVEPNLPTAIVTIVPGGAWVPPGGSWVWTIPSWFESVTG